MSVLLNAINNLFKKKNEEASQRGLNASSVIKPTSVMDTSIVNPSSEGYLPKQNSNNNSIYSPTASNNENNTVAVRDYINNWGQEYGINNDDITWKGDKTDPTKGDVYLNGQYLVTPTENDNGTTYIAENTLKEALNNYYAKNNLQTYKPAEYNSAYASKINQYLDALLNQDKFSYDVNQDEQFKNYEKMYRRLGEIAYNNQIGSNAANTNGRINSWAGTAAAQAQNQYNTQLMDLVPELEQNAYNRYQSEKQDLINKISILENLDNTEYSKYRDAINDYFNKLNYDRGVYESDRDHQMALDQYKEQMEQYNKEYDRDVYESDRDYEEYVRQFNEQINKSKNNASGNNSGLVIDLEEDDGLTLDLENGNVPTIKEVAGIKVPENNAEAVKMGIKGSMLFALNEFAKYGATASEMIDEVEKFVNKYDSITEEFGLEVLKAFGIQ